MDAELLLAHVLERGRTYLFAHPEAVLASEQSERFEGLLARREQREPLPYLLGSWEFLGMRFLVGPGVLSPRPETETLVEAAAERLSPGARVLDVGTGSGCISVGLVRMIPEATVLALEPSPEAREIAGRNFVALGCAERIRLVAGSFPEDARELGPLDAIVSNPPYIASLEVDELAPELRLFEPRGALDGGPEGLDVLGPLATEGAALLKPGGLLAVEVALGQAERVAALFRAAGGWDRPEIIPDLAGIPRVVLTRRRPDKESPAA